MKINLVLKYKLGDEWDFNELDSELLSKIIGQDSIDDLISGLDGAILQEMDDNGNITIKKFIKLKLND